ncbi:MAG: 4-hydroxy-3-methylbut-2-enyl diphosphate reductase [Armatimonadota bacterium]|nr:4-hydroxy-3-methylbut-2-enyl diphosphate reductase [Armatimonadota bacterium]MCX7777480.1 4-hydroxy-3-methylbut-2-enyl diphosphate reductase [Armatimonadota bacterium]MDW8025511.1 4-hydroxy-3-methylbut-2-enyl diphosphate reductase [Armatimonadota bacterium]
MRGMIKLRRIILAKPRGFCAGVVRAIETVKMALSQFPHPIYVHRQIVHNRHVVEELRRGGASFVRSIDEVPDGALIVFNAHGVSPLVREKAEQKKLKVIDATCPLVNKVHAEARRYAAKGYSIVLIGHKGHDEVEGTMGEAPTQTVVVSDPSEVESIELPNPDKVVYLTQTTLSVDAARVIVEALKKRFPHLEAPPSEDICYATQNRQTAVKLLSQVCDGILVVGSHNSSNAQRLCEVASGSGVTAFLVEDKDDIDVVQLCDMATIGITASASTPESIVVGVVEKLLQLSHPETQVEEIEFVREEMRFPLPEPFSSL